MSSTDNNDISIIDANADVITAKGTFIKAKTLFRYLLSKWILITAVGIVGGIIGFYIAYSTKPTYTGALSFVLSTGSKSSGISGLASQFGIDVGGSANNDVFSGDNIISLFKSKRMIKSVLFKKPPETNEILANMIVHDLEWDKAWKKNQRLKHLFPFPKAETKLTPIQDSLLREVYNYIIKKQMTISRTDPKLSTYTLTTTSTNQIVSCYLTRFLMDETAEFYIDTKTSSAKQTLRLLQKETDSLRGLLSGSIVSTAAEGDRTFALNPALQVQRAPAQKGQVRTAVLASAYGEMVKNLQLAKITLQKENPLYQVIDQPELPLVMVKTSKKLAIIAGFALGAFIILMYLVIARMVKSLNS